MKKYKKVVVIVVIAIGIGTTSLIALKSKKVDEETTEVFGTSGNIVDIKEVSKESYNETLECTGKIKMPEKELIYAEADDKILKVDVRVGDSVKKGQNVITYEAKDRQEKEKQLEEADYKIANAVLNIQLLTEGNQEALILSKKLEIEEVQNNNQTLDANIKEAKSNIKIEQDNLQKLREERKLDMELLQQGLMAQNEVDIIESKIKNQQEKIESLQQTIVQSNNLKKLNESKINKSNYDLSLLNNQNLDNELQKNIEIKNNDKKILELEKDLLEMEISKIKNTEVSHSNGIVSEVNVEEGEIVNENKHLMTILNTEKIIVEAEVDPEDVGYLEVGQECNVEYIGKERVSVQGIIKRIAPTITVEEKVNGSITKHVAVEIELKETNEQLREGLEVDVTINLTEPTNTYMVEKTAVIEDQDEHYVYIVRDDFTVEKRQVEIVATTNKCVGITGVQEGEKVVTDEISDLEDGDHIRYKVKN